MTADQHSFSHPARTQSFYYRFPAIRRPPKYTFNRDYSEDTFSRHAVNDNQLSTRIGLLIYKIEPIV